MHSGIDPAESIVIAAALGSYIYKHASTKLLLDLKSIMLLSFYGEYSS